MNNGLSIHVFLDVLFLIINIRDNETMSLIDDLIETYAEELRLNKSIDSVIVVRFLGLLQELKKFPKNEEGDASRISAIANFIINTKDVVEEDHLFFDAMKGIFEAAKKGQQSEEVLTNKKKKIRQILTHNKFKRLTTRMYGKLNECANTSDIELQGSQLADVANLARQIIDGLSCDLTSISNGAEERVVFSDRDSMQVALGKALAVENGTMVLKTGLQGINGMLGHRNGFALGEWVVIYGLSHHFKTGLLLTIARGIAKYNDSAMFCPKDKKPLILLVSLENYANRNLLWFFRTAYACIYGKQPDQNMPIDEIMDFVQDFYTKTGWEFIIERYKGMNFGYDEFVNTVEKYEALGYKVVVAMVDYMEKMKKKSSIYSGDADSHAGLTALADGLFAFCKSKEMLFITPHQFNRKMQEVADRVKTNVVKQFSADGVGGSIAINQIADLEIYVYIESDLDNRAWLTVRRGKHRYMDDTPIAARYCAYLFDPDIGITDDLEGKKRFVRDIYSAGSDTGTEQKADNTLKQYEDVLSDNNF